MSKTNLAPSAKEASIRNANFYYTHLCMALSLFALWGYIQTAKPYLLFFTVLAFYGALCFAFSRITDLIREK